MYVSAAQPFSGLNRRSLLKSAGVLLGASALSSSGPGAMAQVSSSAGEGNGPGHDINQPMIGFMLGHEQF
ncbi:MAG TPA: hypothetical protein VE998_01975, partial [Terriglobales bacterium]|nr:hypothetical protein [Terriglobales bacterium]